MGLGNFFRNIATLGDVSVPELQSRIADQDKKLGEYEERANTFYTFAQTTLGSYFKDDVQVPGPSGDGLNAMRVSTVFACVLVRGESLSTLPASVMQDTSEGSVVASKHPAHYLIHNRANPFQTSAQFWKMVSVKIDLEGECFVTIKYSGRFQPVRLDIVTCAAEVEVIEGESGAAYFKYEGKLYLDYEMLHFKDLSLDGFRGISKIRYNAETIGYSKKLRQYGSNAVGVKPPGFFSTDAPYNTIKQQEEGLQKGWKDNIAEGKTPFLPFGMKYNPMQISPEEAQYLESIGATKEDITAIFRVPPTLVQDYSRATFANAEQQDLVFVKYTMLPIITNIEQECNAKLFSESNATSANPYYVKFNVNAFMRGDFKTQTEGFKTLFQNGMISINGVAELMDWPKIAGGDERYVAMNLIPLSQQQEFIDSLTKPVATNAGNEGGADNAQRGVKLKDLLNGIYQNGHAH